MTSNFDPVNTLVSISSKVISYYDIVIITESKDTIFGKSRVCHKKNVNRRSNLEARGVPSRESHYQACLIRQKTTGRGGAVKNCRKNRGNGAGLGTGLNRTAFPVRLTYPGNQCSKFSSQTAKSIWPFTFI